MSIREGCNIPYYEANKYLNLSKEDFDSSINLMCIDFKANSVVKHAVERERMEGRDTHIIDSNGVNLSLVGGVPQLKANMYKIMASTYDGLRLRKIVASPSVIYYFRIHPEWKNNKEMDRRSYSLTGTLFGIKVYTNFTALGKGQFLLYYGDDKFKLVTMV